jgi:hypothetical protein
MTVRSESSPFTPAHFWRWLLAGALLFAVVAQLEMLALLQLFATADLGRVTLDVGGFQITLSALVTALASGVAYALYAMIFLVNYFFFQRLERVAGGGFVALWLRSILRLSAGILAAWVLRVAFGTALAATMPVVSGGSPMMSWIAFGLIEMIPNAAIGAGFGFLLWSLQHRHSDVLRHRAPSLLRAHVLGGAVGGSLLALAGVALALFQRRVPVALSLIVLALAVVPHLTLTWRAMGPALTESAPDMTGTGAFIARLIVALVPVVAAGVALYWLAAP